MLSTFGDRLAALNARINARLGRQPAWFVLAFVVVNGVHGSDGRDFGILAGAPFSLHPDETRQFLHSSPLPFLLGAPLLRLVGADVAYVLVAALGALLCAVALRRFLRRFPASHAERVCLVLASTPLLLVLTRWIGKADIFLVAAYLTLVTEPRRPGARALLAVVMVLCHRELGTIVLAVHLLLDRRDARPILAGLVIGHALLYLYLHGVLPAPPRSRAQVARGLALELLGSVARGPFAHLAFSFGWFWIFLAAQLRRARERAVLLGAVVVVLLVVSALAADFTRVFVLGALPIIVHVAVEHGRGPENSAAFLLGWPVPMLFLLQFQIEAVGQVHDWSWLR